MRFALVADVGDASRFLLCGCACVDCTALDIIEQCRVLNVELRHCIHQTLFYNNRVVGAHTPMTTLRDVQPNYKGGQLRSRMHRQVRREVPHLQRCQIDGLSTGRTSLKLDYVHRL